MFHNQAHHNTDRKELSMDFWKFVYSVWVLSEFIVQYRYELFEDVKIEGNFFLGGKKQNKER